MSLPGMTESEITRLEMLTLLCMSDRTHSNLIDSMPDKCGPTGQTRDFEPTLKQVNTLVTFTTWTKFILRKRRNLITFESVTILLFSWQII